MRNLHEYRDLLGRYLREQRSAVAVMATLLLLSIALQLAGPQLIRSFLAQARPGAGTRALLYLALAYIGVSMGAQAVRVLAAYWSERVAWVATGGLRLDLAAHLLRLDMEFHKRHTPGELIERVDGDVTALAGFFSSFAIELVGSGLLLAGILVALFQVHAVLGLSFLGLTGLVMLGLGWVRRKAGPSMWANREQSARFYGYVGEVLCAAEDIKPAGATGYVLERFAGYLREWFPVDRRATIWSQLVWVSAMAAFACAEAVAYGLGGALFRSHAVELGTVYMIVAYAAMLGQPLELIRTQLQNLQKADASIARVRELFAIRPALVDGDRKLPPGPLAVELDQVRFCYADGADQPAVDGVTLRLSPGRTLGLLGRTGSGKSTLARLLFRMYDPTAGRVAVGGVDLRQATLRSVRSRVALVTQEVQLFAATLRENITLFDATVPDDRLTAVLTELGLGPWLAQMPQGLDTPIAPSSLSAGEAQLIAFARVFLGDPGLIILDEASSRLDPATEALLTRAVRRLLAGRTAIIIAHRLATVEQVDEILVLEDGHVLEHGPRAALAADPASRFAQLRRMGLEEVLA